MIEKLIAILGWLRNFISPVLITMILGGFVYISLEKSLLGIFLGILIAILGFVIGVYFAERVRTKIGTDKFNAQVMASSDITGKKMKRACQILTYNGMINSEHRMLPLKNKI